MQGAWNWWRGNAKTELETKKFLSCRCSAYYHQNLTEIEAFRKCPPPSLGLFLWRIAKFLTWLTKERHQKFFCADKNYGIRCSNIHMYNSTIKRLGYDWQYPPQEQIWWKIVVQWGLYGTPVEEVRSFFCVLPVYFNWANAMLAVKLHCPNICWNVYFGESTCLDCFARQLQLTVAWHI